MIDPNKNAGIDYVRSKKETRKILGDISARTLRRMELAGVLRPTQITERIKGYRDSEISRLIAERTAK